MNSGAVLIDRYRLIDRLGEGGMSVVWRAHDEVLGREVAVKVLAARASTVEWSRDGIRKEAQSVAKLSHPHIASVFDYGEVADEAGQPVAFVVMELLRGVSLAELAVTPGALGATTALRLCAQVAGALAAAHAEGLVHRDVKPGNIMVTASGAKVFDFGIAAAAGTIDATGPNEPVVGTPAYLAPERIVGGVVSPASDVYALGVLLYRVLTGEQQWSGATPAEIMVAHVYAEPPDLPHIDGVPPNVGALYRRCVAKSPGDRPSARQVAVELAAVVRMSPPLGDDVDVVSGAAMLAHTTALGESSTTVIPNTVLAFTPDAAPRTVASGTRKVLITTAGLAGLVALPILLVITQSWGGSDTVGSQPPATTSVAGSTTTADDSPAPSPTASTASTVRAGDVPSSEARPPAPAGSPTVPPPDPTPAAASTTATVVVNEPADTFASAGGTVSATCDGTATYLSSWTPAQDYEVRTVKRGPAPKAVITFKNKGTEVTMTATCPAGVPVVSTSTKG